MRRVGMRRHRRGADDRRLWADRVSRQEADAFRLGDAALLNEQVA